MARGLRLPFARSKHPRATGRRTGPPSAAGEQEVEDIRESGEGEGQPGRGQVLKVRARGRASGLRKKQQVPCRRGSRRPVWKAPGRLGLQVGQQPQAPGPPSPRLSSLPGAQKQQEEGPPWEAPACEGTQRVAPVTRPEGGGAESRGFQEDQGSRRPEGPPRTVWGLAVGGTPAGLWMPPSPRPGQVPASGRGARLHTTPGPSWAPPGTLLAELETREGVDVDASEAEKVNRTPSGQRGALLTPPPHLWAIRGQRCASCSPRVAGVVLAAGSRRRAGMWSWSGSALPARRPVDGKDPELWS